MFLLLLKITKVCCIPMCKNQGLPNAHFGHNLNSEFCIHQPLLFYTLGLEIIVFENRQVQKTSVTSCESKQKFDLFDLSLLFLSYTSPSPANDWAFLGDVDRRAEMSVRVWKCCFIVETFRHYNFGSNALFEIL